MSNGLGVSSAQNGLAGLSTAPAVAPAVEAPAPVAQPSVATSSPVVQRLMAQNATVYGPGLAQIPLPKRDIDVPRAAPKKEASPMTAPRTLDGGRSPLAPESLQDAAAGTNALGSAPAADGEASTIENARAGANRMPSAHGLVAYTSTSRGDRVYLTQERWLHIKENHIDPAPQQRGKRTTTYWPTTHSLSEPTMNEQQVIGVIVDAARKGQLRNEVRDTRMAEYDLPSAQADAYGVSEAKVSMAPDGLVLSAYPAAGNNVLAVYEMNAADQAELERITGAADQPAAPAADERLFQTNVASTSYGD